jgi:hypothetical protein
MNNHENRILDGINLIDDFGDNLHLSSEGHNDVEGYQIFTPNFIVNDMIKMIGLKAIMDINNNILEPTSGDGAFTVRILELRLKNLNNDNEFLIKALKGLSTIYSIELDRDLLLRQRSNLYSAFMNQVKNKSIQIHNRLVDLVKRIIVTNVIWGETNIREEFSKNNIIGWYMPLPMMKDTKHRDIPNYTKAEVIKFSRWNINNDLSYTQVFEDAVFDNSIDETQIGGLFDEW